MVGRAWSASDDQALVDAVRVHGHQWSVVGPALGRTGSAVRGRWRVVSGRLVAHPTLAAVAGAVSPAWVSTGGPLVSRRSPSRDRRGGRPWDRVISRGHSGGRRPTFTQSQWLHNWGLLVPQPVWCLCNLARAVSILCRRVPQGRVRAARTRVPWDDLVAWGMVYLQGDACHTMTSSIANMYWVCGPTRAGFCTPAEVARFMGFDSRGGVFVSARRIIPSDYRLNYCLAESVHRLTAMHAGQSALSRVPPGTSLRTVGSLYSGCFDELASGFVYVGVPLYRVFAAECDQDKRAVLQASFGYPDALMYQCVSEAGERCPSVDVLTVSPPCRAISQAHTYSSDLERDGVSVQAVEEHIEAILAVARRAGPKVMVVEQSSGLATHFPGLFSRFDQAIRGLGFSVFYELVDARDLGATHHRSRCTWVCISEVLAPRAAQLDEPRA